GRRNPHRAGDEAHVLLALQVGPKALDVVDDHEFLVVFRCHTKESSLFDPRQLVAGRLVGLPRVMLPSHALWATTLRVGSIRSCHQSFSSGLLTITTAGDRNPATAPSD